jgi:hypothetical protein
MTKHERIKKIHTAIADMCGKGVARPTFAELESAIVRFAGRFDRNKVYDGDQLREDVDATTLNGLFSIVLNRRTDPSKSAKVTKVKV